MIAQIWRLAVYLGPFITTLHRLSYVFVPFLLSGVAKVVLCDYFIFFLKK
jgi:hypothetical protein